jgi:hypothetical protein
MRSALAITAVLFAASAWAAEPKTNFVDHSNDILITEAAAKAVMKEHVPSKVWKLYPASKFSFVSQVEGGLKGSTCVVTARVMLLPLTSTLKIAMFRPEKTATSFDAVPNSSPEACKETAKAKLIEATAGVVSALVKT